MANTKTPVVSLALALLALCACTVPTNAAPGDNEDSASELKGPAKAAAPSGSLPKLLAIGKDLCGQKPLAWSNRELAAGLDGLVADLTAVRPGARGICTIELGDESTKPAGTERERRPGAYSLALSGDTLRVRGLGPEGIRNGLIAAGRRMAGGEGKLADFTEHGAPLHGVRYLHMVIQGVSPEEAERTVRYAMWERFNGLIVRVSDSVSWSTLERMGRKGESKQRQPWSREQLSAFTRFARARGFEVIPELKLLTHQEWFLEPYRPDLMMHGDTWNPRNEEVYRITAAVMDEVKAAMAPTAIHIGHDEVKGWPSWQKGQKGGAMRAGFTADDFLNSVRRSHDIARKKGLEVWMWGDMFLLPERYPGMLNKNIHGVAPIWKGLASLPKDIVIVDWHYWDTVREFPTARDLEQAGHRVLGSTWKQEETIRNFARYWGKQSKGGAGMVATMWFHLPRGEWNEVGRIIRTSGEEFWGAS